MNTSQHHASSQHKPRNFAGLVYISALVVCLLSQTRTVHAEGDAGLAGVVGNGTPASCDSNALQTALNGGGLVTFNCGLNPVTIISNTYVISTDTTVDGGGLITLDGENLRQHFLVQPSVTLTLHNINLHKGDATNGGSIYINNNATVNIRTVNFVGNTANETGGAIYNLGTLDISDAIFTQNKTVTNTIAIGYGGAIGNLGVMTLTRGFFDNNDGRFGGAVFVGGTSNARATIANTTFNQNRASQLGGGLYTNAETTAITVTRSIFVGNSANTGGGLGRFSAQLRVLDSSFVQNSATTGGGGLYLAAGPTASAGGYVQLRSVTVSGNTATGGQSGGILNNGQVEVYFSTIVSNTKGIFSSGAGVITRLRSTVLQNPGHLNCDGTGITPTNDGFNHSSDGSCGATIPDAGDAKLGPLQNDGPGTTSYHLPLAGSPLINAGALDCPPTDQRGATRSDGCDLGAVEFGGLIVRARLPIVIR
jgi:predicted outer membrane repeat protein